MLANFSNGLSCRQRSYFAVETEVLAARPQVDFPPLP